MSGITARRAATNARPCPVCAAQQASIVDAQRLSGPAASLTLFAGMHVVQCAECATKFTDSAPSPLELADFYTSYRGQGRASAEHAPLSVEDMLASTRAVSHLSLLSQHHPRFAAGGARLLEIGPGFGQTLLLARVYFDADVVAFEPDHEAAQFLVANHVANYASLFDEQTSSALGHSFDAVIASMVIEHVADPVGFLRLIRSVLLPGGVIVCEVPNYADELFSFRNSDDAHLFFPTPETLELAARMAGLTTLSCKACGPRWAGDPAAAAQNRRFSQLPRGSRARRFLRSLVPGPTIWVEDLLFRPHGNTVKAVFGV